MGPQITNTAAARMASTESAAIYIARFDGSIAMPGDLSRTFFAVKVIAHEVKVDRMAVRDIDIIRNDVAPRTTAHLI